MTETLGATILLSGSIVNVSPKVPMVPGNDLPEVLSVLVVFIYAVWLFAARKHKGD